MGVQNTVLIQCRTPCRTHSACGFFVCTVSSLLAILFFLFPSPPPIRVTISPREGVRLMALIRLWPGPCLFFAFLRDDMARDWHGIQAGMRSLFPSQATLLAEQQDKTGFQFNGPPRLAFTAPLFLTTGTRTEYSVLKPKSENKRALDH